jgi:hypothetical protein
MKMETPQKMANLPAVARCGGSKKRLICMSLRAPTTIATSFIKIRKNRSYKILSKLVAMVAMVAMVATRGHNHLRRSADNSASARLLRTVHSRRGYGLR